MHSIDVEVYKMHVKAATKVYHVYSVYNMYSFQMSLYYAGLRIRLISTDTKKNYLRTVLTVENYVKM